MIFAWSLHCMSFLCDCEPFSNCVLFVFVSRLTINIGFARGPFVTADIWSRLINWIYSQPLQLLRGPGPRAPPTRPFASQASSSEKGTLQLKIVFASNPPKLPLWFLGPQPSEHAMWFSLPPPEARTLKCWRWRLDVSKESTRKTIIAPPLSSSDSCPSLLIYHSLIIMHHLA